jgi:hypothetical protein
MCCYDQEFDVDRFICDVDNALGQNKCWMFNADCNSIELTAATLWKVMRIFEAAGLWTGPHSYSFLLQELGRHADVPEKSLSSLRLHLR